MDWQALKTGWGKKEPIPSRKRWVMHGGHDRVATPHRLSDELESRTEEPRVVSSRLITLDGSRGEGGGQILRTALTLSLLTGRSFRIVKIRANRDKPGLRPQHLKAVEAAASLAGAEVVGASIGSRDLTFRPAAYTPRDLQIDIGTAGSTALVLQTLHLPLALRAEQPIRVTLTGGTFNTAAPSFPFLETTWRAHLARLGSPMALAMPAGGFYPRGGGRLDAWIEPATLKSLTMTERGPLTRLVGIAGVANLRPEIAQRMRDRAQARLAERGLSAEIELIEWPSLGQGAAISLSATYGQDGIPATFVGLGERGKPAEVVADEAVDEWLAFHDAEGGAVDPHSADQILVPLALAASRSEYSVSAVTEHLLTNVATIRAFLDREIEVEESDGDGPGRVIIA
ncbi:RNA 3'-terminal phosphate cyclase (ATP) [Singulisphaera sp. GP187]|uniref:RNA 3'-terminal phosphate cyclase n=1 Tax=Singulisphaera sp. GP187 TaxID=1882752 RepID=UPI000927846D|nr:RNA 3'-terminal phosphate cyclase [Singulisphaera sp. GP187]SIO42068.1 RNA 3'-terminal phosphate cyclase (ATP) [Singulisphaera sp. GP187]